MISRLLSLATAAIIAALVVGPLPVMAQQPVGEPPRDDAEMSPDEVEEADEEAFFGDSHRRRIYEQSRLSRTRATLYNLGLPGMGNVYAEQYFYAGIAFSLLVFSGVFVGYGLYTDQSNYVWAGATTAGTAYIGSILTSLQGVHDYNQKLRQGLKIEANASLTPFEPPRAPTVDFALEF